MNKVLGEINMEDLIVRQFQLIALKDNMQTIVLIYAYHFAQKIKIISETLVQDYA